MIVLEGGWRGWEVPDGPKSVTIGVLDGVHLGHRRLLAGLDPDLERTVLTFDPHPVEVLRPGTPPRLLTTLPERARLLGDAGIGVVGVLDLSEIREQTPEEFVSDVLLDKIGASHVVVGEDFRFGKDRSGDVALLARLSDDTGFALDVIGIVGAGGSPVSSSRIREMVESGAVAEASTLMGSYFSVTNTVVGGERRGREIGFPTANLRPPSRKILPAHGIYACSAIVGETRHQAAVNVGTRPTFGGEEVLIEAYLLDFDEDIYGNDLTLEFVEHLRPEIAFPGVEPLVAQMHLDVERTREVLAGPASRI